MHCLQCHFAPLAHSGCPKVEEAGKTRTIRHHQRILIGKKMEMACAWQSPGIMWQA